MKIERLSREPIISTATHRDAGDNINGPSLIRVPNWITNPLGRYYLYFAHHNGQFIRLAYADELKGPWKTLPSGVLPLEKSGFQGHIASPDVHVDNDSRRIMMYFHGSDTETDASSPQYTRLAISVDGLGFSTITDNLGGAYWRVFRVGHHIYALEMPGVIRRAESISGPFERGPALFNDRMRHSAVSYDGQSVDVFYSNVGDNPESILHTKINVENDWRDWSTGAETIVASPQGKAEGETLAAVPSQRGIARQPVHELRDPAYFEEDGIRYLLYSVAGEQGIAIATLR